MQAVALPPDTGVGTRGAGSPSLLSFLGFPVLAIRSPLPFSLPSFTFRERTSLLKGLCR